MGQLHSLLKTIKNDMKAIEFDFFNIGGVQKIYAIPDTSLLRIREDFSSGKCFPDLVRMEDIIEIYTVYDTVIFNEEQSRNTPGTAYSVSISGIIPKACLPNRRQLQTLENTPLFVLFLDCNGNIRLAGTEENRLIFTRKETTGTVNTRNQIEFEIRGMQASPCYFIDPKELEFI
jgi:hypothetical protein